MHIPLTGTSEKKADMPEGLAQEGIVVGVDGSEHSNVAVRWAAHEAAMRSAPLNLVYIATTPLGGWGAWGLSGSPLPEDFGQRREEEGRQIIADTKRIAEYHGDALRAPRSPGRHYRLRSVCAMAFRTGLGIRAGKLKWSMNRSRASTATFSSAPGSSKR